MGYNLNIFLFVIFQDNFIDSCPWPGSQMEHIWSGILGRFVDCNFRKAWIYKQLSTYSGGGGGQNQGFWHK